MPTIESDPVLRRIRGLLDQAENTPYPSEAETFAAKAAELMARYRVDDAMLARRRGHAASRQIIETNVELGRGQYVRARLSLLGVIADAYDCRLLSSSGVEGRTGHVIGQADDIDHVTVLYTSLLVQATRAAANESPPKGHSGVAFRRGFLLGFAHRIGERLSAQMADVVQEVDTDAPTRGQSVALVLADRRAAVDSWVSDRYGRLGRLGRAAPISEVAAQRGKSAGDHADLGGVRLGDGPTALDP